MRQWHMKRQQFLDGPAMIGDASSHRWGGPATGVGQTRMGCAEIIDRTYKVPTMLQCQRATRQRATSACQRGQTRTEGHVQSFEVGRIDDAVALQTPPARLNACRGAIDNAAFGLDHPSPLVALDDLRDQDMAPRTPPGPSALPRVHGLARGCQVNLYVAIATPALHAMGCIRRRPPVEFSGETPARGRPSSGGGAAHGRGIDIAGESWGHVPGRRGTRRRILGAPSAGSTRGWEGSKPRWPWRRQSGGSSTLSSPRGPGLRRHAPRTSSPTLSGDAIDQR